MVLLFLNAMILVQFCTIIMAKDNQRRVAKELFLQGKNQKEIARLVNVQEKTMGEWVKKYAWKEERDARLNNAKSQAESLKILIGKLTERRLDLIRTMDQAQKDDDDEKYDALETKASRIADEISKYNKTLLTLDKENRISLSVYLDVMESIFKAIQVFDAELYMKLIDFQDEHLTEISLKFR
jgi:uncharacterized protein YjcR